MQFEGYKNTSRALMIVGAVMILAGFAVLIKASKAGGAILMVIGITIAMIGVSISSFLNKYDFYQTVEMASRNKNKKKE